MKRLIAIGDIHGMRDKLAAIIELIRPDNDTRIILLGDLLDRGENSKGVLDLVLKLRQRFDLQCVRGNHDQFYIDWQNGDEEAAATAIMNGGIHTLQSYGYDIGEAERFRLPQEHYKYLASQPLSIETENHFFCHAGCRPGIALADQTSHDLLWIRNDFHQSDYDWGKVVVTGHSPVREPVIKPNLIRLDTGACRNPERGYGKLTACDVLSGELWQS